MEAPLDWDDCSCFTQPGAHGESLALIIDNGSSTTKAGFGGDDAPSIVFPTIVGKVKYKASVHSLDRKRTYVGDQAQSKRGMLLLTYPIERGVATNFDELEKIWHHTFYEELRVDPTEHPVLLTEPPLNSRACREQMASVMFGVFDVPAMYLVTQAMLALCAHERTTGVVVESGDGVTFAVPFWEGFSIPHSIMRLDTAGRDLTEYMMRLLTENGFHFTNTADFEAVRDIKEKFCYLASDFDAEMKAFKRWEQYEMPSGDFIRLGSERFRCPELLFRPNPNFRSNDSGLQDIIFDSINKNEKDIRCRLWQNVLLSGGNTMFAGIQERLTTELLAKVDGRVKVKVTAMPERKYAVWIGGSILSTLDSMKQMWVSNEEYLQVPNIVNAKCL